MDGDYGARTDVELERELGHGATERQETKGREAKRETEGTTETLRLTLYHLSPIVNGACMCV